METADRWGIAALSVARGEPITKSLIDFYFGFNATNKAYFQAEGEKARKIAAIADWVEV